MTPEQLTALAQKSVDRARAAETANLAAIARRLAKGIADEKWATKKLAEMGSLRAEMRRTVQALARCRSADSKDIIATAYMTSRAETEKTLAAADLAPVETAVPAGLARTFAARPEKAIAALTRDLEGRLAKTDKHVLRASEDIYRQVIGRVTAQGFEGEFTRRTAAQAALNIFADRGIPPFTDLAGKVWSLPSYTEMSCRTAALNASRAGKTDSMRAAGQDLAIVSTSPSACPDCAEWEGKIISLDGTTPGYPTLADAEGSGHLFGPNCGHQADPYVEGVTVDTSAPSDPELYAARQTQRGMERSIRQWKTRQAVATLDPRAAAVAKAKVSEWQGKLREHVAANDLKRLSAREQIGKAI